MYCGKVFDMCLVFECWNNYLRYQFKTIYIYIYITQNIKLRIKGNTYPLYVNVADPTCLCWSLVVWRHYAKKQIYLYSHYDPNIACATQINHVMRHSVAKNRHILVRGFPVTRHTKCKSLFKGKDFILDTFYEWSYRCFRITLLSTITRLLNVYFKQIL